jgi:hypothetical protein
MYHFSNIGFEFFQSGRPCLKYMTLQITPQKIVRAEKSGDLGGQFKS